MVTSKKQIETIERFNALDNGFTAFPDELYDQPMIRLYDRVTEQPTGSIGVGESHTVEQWLKLLNDERVFRVYIAVEHDAEKFDAILPDNWKEVIVSRFNDADRVLYQKLINHKKV